MIVLVNFADNKFRRNQKWSSFTAKHLGKIDRVIEYNPKDIENQYYESNKESVKYQKKGFGNYFWKPIIVNEAFNQLEDGDYLFYSDSGTVFIKSVVPIIRYMEMQKKNIMCFKLPLIERQWTKRDTFVLMDCDRSEYTDTCQILATFFIVKKSKEGKEFLKNYMKYASDSRILSDDNNEMGKENYPEFIEHRHDQSILSLLGKKSKDTLIEGDISDYGYFPYRYIQNKKFIFNKEMIENTSNNKFKGSLLSNRSVHPLLYFIKYLIRLILYKFKIRT